MATKTPELSGSYTVEKSEHDIGELRGQMAVLQEALTQPDTNLTPNVPATGNIQYSAAGHQGYASSDGNTYNTGRNTLSIALGVPFTVTGTTNTNVTGWSIPLLGGAVFRVYANLDITNGANTTNTPVVNFNHSGALGGMRVKARFMQYSTVTSGNSTLGTASPPNNWSWTGATMGTSGGSYNWEFTGQFSVTNAGTFSFQIASSAGGLSWTINTYSVFELLPVTV